MRVEERKSDHQRRVELSLVCALLICQLVFFGFRFIEVETVAVAAELPVIDVVPAIPTTHPPKPPEPPKQPSEPIPSDDPDIPPDATIMPISEYTFDLPNAPVPPPPDINVPFMVYDQAPQPLAGWDAISKTLIYPEIPRKANIEARVIVNVLIDVDGTVAAMKIIVSGGLQSFDDAAINALRNIKWKPAMQRDKPVRVWVAIPVVFTLK